MDNVIIWFETRSFVSDKCEYSHQSSLVMKECQENCPVQSDHEIS